MNRSGITGANGPASPTSGLNVLPFPQDGALKATEAKMDAANKAWDVFLAAHRSALTVGSVNSMRASIAAFELFEAAVNAL